MTDDKEILEMIKEIGAMVREEEKNIGSANNIIKRMEEGAGKDILKATLEASEDTLIKHKCLINWLVELRARRNAEEWTHIEDGAGKTLQRIEQWQELKETIIELRDNDGTGTQQEVCKFLANYMGVLEKQMEEPKTGHWILTDVEGYRVWHCNCSECGKDPQDYTGGSEDWWLIKSKLPKFCPNCGSDNRER